MTPPSDLRTFRNEDLVLKVSSYVDLSTWDESKYDAFLDELCGYREYQKEAIKITLRYLLGNRYSSLRDLARENFTANEELKHRWARWENMERNLQLPDQLSCSLDLATGTGKSFVLYALATIMLAEGIVDRVLVLCPSNTIEAGLYEKFKDLASNSNLRDLMPPQSKTATPHVINASESIVDGSLCVENYHAILEHTRSSIRDSLKGCGSRVAILNDEAHHVANEKMTAVKRWKEFLLNPEYGFKYIVGVSGTCYVGNDYFADVIYRYSLRQAIEDRFVKRVEYVAEMPDTNAPEEKWQLIWKRHEDWKSRLKSRNIRPLTIIVTRDIRSCKQVAIELEEWLTEWEGITNAVARDKVIAVSSAKEHQPNIAALKLVDSPRSNVEWIVSVSMLSEGWDVKNVFQIVPHEERAFNSKLLIAQVLGRGLRRPDNWAGDDPIVTVFNHSAWSGNIKRLVNEILEIEQRLTSLILPESPFHFDLYNFDYTREEDTSEYTKTGEYRLFEDGYVALPTQVENEAVTVEFERAVTGEHYKFSTNITHKTYTVEESAGQLYQRLKSIDEESANAEDPLDRTNYSHRFTFEKCKSIVTESLRRANITNGRITDENRQKLLQALGPLRRKAAKRVIYKLSPLALKMVSSKQRQAESCSAAELRRASKTIFYTDVCASTLPDEQLDFFKLVEDPDGDFVSGRVLVENPACFRTPINLAIADAGTERRFIRGLIDKQNAAKIDAWLKNTHIGFYSLEYAWRKKDHPRRGEFSPDFFIKQGDWVFVVEVKDDSEIDDPSPENIKKYEYAHKHFQNLNSWLEEQHLPARYQFNMLSPRDFNMFFQFLREENLIGFKSNLDVSMMNS